MHKPTITCDKSGTRLKPIPFNGLANQLFIEELRAKPDDDIALSALGVQLALGMVTSGASVDPGRLPLTKHYSSMLARFSRPSPGFEVSVRNGIFSHEGIDFVPAFLNHNLRHFGAQNHTLDLSSGTPFAAMRNWVSDATRLSSEGKASTLTRAPSITPGTSMILINTIAFAGLYRQTPLKTDSLWRSVLSEEDLRNGDLKPVREAKVVFAEDDRERLHDSAELSFCDSAYSEVLVPPHSGCCAPRRIIMAKENARETHELLTLSASRNEQGWKTSDFTTGLPVEVREIQCHSELNREVLAGWIGGAFNPSERHLAGLYAGAAVAFISSVKQRVVCRIDEPGVKGFAVTHVEIALTDTSK
jgi:hypothetical protein